MWFRDASVKRVAHAKVSTRAERLAKYTTVIAGLLSIFTGTVWTVDLADIGVPSTVVQWAAAFAAFGSAALLAISKGFDWTQEAQDHSSAKKRWAQVVDDIDDLRLMGKYRDELSDKDLATVKADRDKAVEGNINLTERDLDKARAYLAKTYPETFAT